MIDKKKLGLGIGIGVGILGFLSLPIIPEESKTNTIYKSPFSYIPMIGNNFPTIVKVRQEQGNKTVYVLFIGGKKVYEYVKRDKAENGLIQDE